MLSGLLGTDFVSTDRGPITMGKGFSVTIKAGYEYALFACFSLAVFSAMMTSVWP
jgi:hypothetical protein